MQPIDYLQGDNVNLGQSIASGILLGSQIRSLQDRQQDRQQAQMLAEQNQQQQLLQQQQQQQRAQMLEDARVLAVRPNASPQDRLTYLSLMSDHQKAKQMQEAFASMAPDVVSNNLKQIAKTAALLNSPKPELGIKQLETMQTAARNSGDMEEVQEITQMISAAKTNPSAIADTLALMAASMNDDGKKFYDKYQSSLSLRTDVAKKEAETKTAQTTAKYSESTALQSLEKQGWDISKIKADINYQKEASKIAAMNAQIAREANALRREDLKIQRDERQRKIDEEISNKVADYETAKGSIENLKSTVSKALGYDMDVIKSATGPVAQYIPTVSEDTADFEETINTLGSQAFLAMIPTMKGTGALSEQEGKKLESSLASLSLRQSPGQLINNLKTVNTLMEKAKKTLDVKYGAPKKPSAPAPAARTSNVIVDY